jgi:arylsulfatase A-like enzyme
MMVVQIVVSSLRADAPGFAGGEVRTPALDALAEEGTRWPHLQVSGGWAIPSLLSMVTGTFPHRLGVSRWRHPFPARRPTLLSAFAAAGFQVHVAAHNPRWMLGTLPHRGNAVDSQQPAQVVELLRGPRGRDRFVLIHHWWTHLPYVSRRLPNAEWHRACDLALTALNRHPEKTADELRASYLRSVEYFSGELLGRYLDAACAGGEDVLLLVTGDHGESWGAALPTDHRIEHVFDLHGRWLTDETTLVPLLWWGKAHGGAIPPGAQRQGTVRGVDLAPTLAELAGIPWPGPLPSTEAPTVVDRGITPDGGGLELDGISAAQALLAGRDVPGRAALTVSSHNTAEPSVFPPDGRQMWRFLASRTDDGWYRLDGAGDHREAETFDGTPPPDDEAEQTWDQLLEEWHRSVGPGGELDPGLFPTTRRGTAHDDFDGEVDE